MKGNRVFFLNIHVIIRVPSGWVELVGEKSLRGNTANLGLEGSMGLKGEVGRVLMAGGATGVKSKEVKVNTVFGD